MKTETWIRPDTDGDDTNFTRPPKQFCGGWTNLHEFQILSQWVAISATRVPRFFVAAHAYGRMGDDTNWHEFRIQLPNSWPLVQFVSHSRYPCPSVVKSFGLARFGEIPARFREIVARFAEMDARFPEIRISPNLAKSR